MDTLLLFPHDDTMSQTVHGKEWDLRVGDFVKISGDYWYRVADIRHYVTMNESPDPIQGHFFTMSQKHIVMEEE